MAAEADVNDDIDELDGVDELDAGFNCCSKVDIGSVEVAELVEVDEEVDEVEDEPFDPEIGE